MAPGKSEDFSLCPFKAATQEMTPGAVRLHIIENELAGRKSVIAMAQSLPLFY